MANTKIPTYNSSTLVEHISDTFRNRTTTKYCFILGSGASRSSGIRTGGELASVWFEGIQRLFKDTYKQWVIDDAVDLDDLAASYSKIYAKRFEIDPSEGYHFIQKEIAKSKLSYGYSILSRLLLTQHNVVVTTNFDPLTEDALFIYTNKRPLVCGHESLSVFVDPVADRPTVIKVHRDQLLGPKSTTTDISKLGKGFKDSLNNILRIYTPIVIGYGGNDPSLMDYLDSCSFLKGMFWCTRTADGLSEPIKNLLRKKKGKIFEIPGFDELMFKIHAAVFSDEPPLNETITAAAAEKAEEWGRQYAELSGKLSEPSSKASLVELTKDQPYKSWWDVELAVNATDNIEAKNKLFVDGVAQFPNNDELAGNYARFLKNIKKNYDAAEEYYLKALELAPYKAFNTGSYALFLEDIRKDYDAAEKHYVKALGLDPDIPSANENYANFLYKIKKDYDLAERYFLKALEVRPSSPYANCNYAQFLIAKGKFSLAKGFIDKAFERVQLPEHGPVFVELWYYRFANFYDEYPNAEKELQKLIADGVRSDGWDFSDNIEEAKKTKHPKLAKVIEYAEKISGNKYH